MTEYAYSDKDELIAAFAAQQAAHEKLIDDLEMRVQRLQAELALLRPWAEFARLMDPDERYRWDGACIICNVAFGHSPDCPVPQMEAQIKAQLKTDNA